MDQKEEILDKTNGGLKVFQHYLGSKVAPGVKFKNPFYTDTKASCNLYYGKKCDRYFLVDFGDFLSILVIVLFAVIASGLFLDGKIWIITMILTRS